ncbi:MAG TPA: hypothetical protein PKM93_12915 [Prolixibacteraceae bacterium]|jgi:hypothetical protein|nr:hypothetical protein [Prolixibacteraceae bacterium]HQB58914.1 hypothetical protein [Bacteroidales bacterium]
MNSIKKIGEHLKSINYKSVKLLIDPACGGGQRIPLFFTDCKSSATKLCDVDLMILKNERIKIIIEIEESSKTPHQILGKLMCSALAKFYKHKESNDKEIQMDDNVCFIQILDTRELKEKSKKIPQWKNIELAINEILSTLKTNIKTYKLFYGKLDDINLNEISLFIKKELEN